MKLDFVKRFKATFNSIFPLNKNLSLPINGTPNAVEKWDFALASPFRNLFEL